MDAAKAAPGSYPYGSSGNYGTMHVPMEMLTAASGAKMLHVPFTGRGPRRRRPARRPGRCALHRPCNDRPHVQGGKVRVLANWGDGRQPALPDVPTLKELGYDAQFSQWTGLFVPAGTPEPVIAKLREAARAAGNDPKVREVLLKAGSPVLYQDAPDFQKYVDADAQKMAEVVKKIGKLE